MKAYKEINWKGLHRLDPADKTLNRKTSDNIMITSLGPHSRSIYDTITSLFYMLGYKHSRHCTIITGGNKDQRVHNDEGLDTSYSVIIALHHRKFTIWYTDGTHRVQTLELEVGDVLVFNTNVWHAGAVNEVASAAMFLYYDKVHPTQETVMGKGYNNMANPHSQWTQSGGFEEYAVKRNAGDEQNLLCAMSLDELPMHIWRLSIGDNTKVLRALIEKQFTK